MSKYRFYIVNDRKSDIFGTDDEAVAEKLSYDDDNWIIDTERGQQIQMGTIGERFDIPRYVEPTQPQG